jgi:hypothetical protein
MTQGHNDSTRILPVEDDSERLALLLSEMATLAGGIVAELNLAATEVERMREQLELDMRFKGILTDVLGGHERRIGPAAEPVLRNVEVLLDMIAAKGAEAVDSEDVQPETIAQLAHFFDVGADRAWTAFIHSAEVARMLEIQSDFGWSLAEWVRARGATVKRPAGAVLSASPYPLGSTSSTDRGSRFGSSTRSSSLKRSMVNIWWLGSWCLVVNVTTQRTLKMSRCRPRSF